MDRKHLGGVFHLAFYAILKFFEPTHVIIDTFFAISNPRSGFILTLTETGPTL
jgi:hypothetical protein